MQDSRATVLFVEMSSNTKQYQLWGACIWDLLSCDALSPTLTRHLHVVSFRFILFHFTLIHQPCENDLVAAARKGDVATVTFLLDEGADVNDHHKVSKNLIWM